MAPEYTVQLANGVYMGSDGSFSGMAPAGVPIIGSTKFQVPVDPAKVKDVLNSIADGIKSVTDPKNPTTLLLRRLGITGELLTALKDFGKFAADLAKFVPYVNVALALADFFGVLGDSEGKVSPALQQRFTQINEMIKAQDRKWSEVTAAGFKNPVLTLLDSVRAYAGKMSQYNDVPPAAADWTALDLQRETFLTTATSQPDGALNSLKNFLTPALWESYYTGRDPDNPNGSWDPLRPVFHLTMQDDAGNWQPAAAEPIGTVSRFDHRVMAHIVPGLIQSYLTTIKLLLPEYRSTTRFREHLLSLAQLVETLMERMRKENLGRTSFTSGDFANPLWLPPGPLGFPVPPQPRFDVGGYDLAAARTLPPGQTAWPNTGWWDTSDQLVDFAAMTYNWPPPTSYQNDGTRDSQGWYRWDLLNTVECVNALNSESAVRFSSLLYSSGYLQLAQTAALLRHLCVAPEASETVMAGFHSSVKEATPTTVPIESKAIIPFDPISLNVKRIPRSVSVTARVLTQSPVNVTLDPITYKVYLRTMPARTIDARSDYSSFYWTTRQTGGSYDSLVCTYTEGHLDQEEVVEGRTPRVVKTGMRRTVTLHADTFDIWVPVPDGPGLMTDIFTGIDKSIYVTTAAGNATSSRYVSTLDELVGEFIASEQPSTGEDAGIVPPKQNDLGSPLLPDPKGERRNLKRDELTLQYEWSWNGPTLELRIDAADTQDTGSEPRANPNADLYLVVEEHIVGGQWRHSSFRIPIATQLTYVPQSFLDAEAKLADEANDFWRGLVTKYVEVGEVSPEDPVAQLGRASLRSAEQRLALFTAAQKHAPELLAQHLREAGLRY